MVMLRPTGKAYEIAKRVLKNKGIKVPKPSSDQKLKKHKITTLSR